MPWQFRTTLAAYRRQLAVGGVLILLGSALTLALPWPLKIVIDNVLQDRPLTGPSAAVLGHRPPPAGPADRPPCQSGLGGRRRG